jgi:hypothetical protein
MGWLFQAVLAPVIRKLRWPKVVRHRPEARRKSTRLLVEPARAELCIPVWRMERLER